MLLGVGKEAALNFVADKTALANAFADEKPTDDFSCYQGVDPSLLENNTKNC